MRPFGREHKSRPHRWRSSAAGSEVDHFAMHFANKLLYESPEWVLPVRLDELNRREVQ
jgi:hypothetical protein